MLYCGSESEDMSDEVDDEPLSPDELEAFEAKFSRYCGPQLDLLDLSNARIEVVEGWDWSVPFCDGVARCADSSLRCRIGRTGDGGGLRSIEGDERVDCLCKSVGLFREEKPEKREANGLSRARSCSLRAAGKVATSGSSSFLPLARRMLSVWLPEETLCSIFGAPSQPQDSRLS